MGFLDSYLELLVMVLCLLDVRVGKRDLRVASYDRHDQIIKSLDPFDSWHVGFARWFCPVDLLSGSNQWVYSVGLANQGKAAAYVIGLTLGLDSAAVGFTHLVNSRLVFHS